MSEKDKAMQRKIELKEILATEDEPALSYRDNILGLLRTPRSRETGADAAEMAQVIPIIQKVKDIAAGDDLYLDEGDWKVIRDRAMAFKYGANSEVVDDFTKYIKKASKVPFVKVEGAEEIIDDTIDDEPAADDEDEG